MNLPRLETGCPVSGPDCCRTMALLALQKQTGLVGPGAGAPLRLECSFCEAGRALKGWEGARAWAPIGHSQGRARLAAAPVLEQARMRCGGGGGAAAWSRPGRAGGPGGCAPPPSKRPGGAAPGPSQPRQAKPEDSGTRSVDSGPTPRPSILQFAFCLSLPSGAASPTLVSLAWDGVHPSTHLSSMKFYAGSRGRAPLTEWGTRRGADLPRSFIRFFQSSGNGMGGTRACGP